MRTLTICALVILVATTVILDRAILSTPLSRGLIEAGLAAWLVTFVLDFLVHSRRLNSRMVMVRLQSVRAELDELQLNQPPEVNPQRGRTVAS